MDFVQENLIDPLSHILYTYVLIYLLLGAGLYFTFRTKFVQVRYFVRMTRYSWPTATPIYPASCPARSGAPHSGGSSTRTAPPKSG